MADLTEQQRQEFLTDPLGKVAQLLGQASMRIVYDLHRFHETGQPVFAATLARETHANDSLPPGGLKIQVALGYSDGFGREIQKKVQAEPGPITNGGPLVSPRWVGSGWTIFNNKGKPVKQFEPFFDDTHAFRFNHQIGVSSTVVYDPTERVVATLLPNHTWEKVVFDPWRNESWDVNDTVLIADPKTDPDVGEFFQRLSDTDYLPTWHAQRQGGALGPHEQAAAVKTTMHAATPSIVYSDSLGRSFLTVAHNRYERNGNTVNEQYVTRVVFDIEGNQREVIDAKNRIVMRYNYDLLGTWIYQASMEAGERWILNDVTSKPIYAWDSRNHRFRTAYDPLRRPTGSFLSEGGASEKLIGQTVYGESQPDPEAKNQRGKVVTLRDQAGVVTTEDYDFKGNLLQSKRELAGDYKTTIDWLTAPALEPESFAGSTTYDALNRPITATSPDGSVYRPTFNEANLLEKVDVNLRGEAAATPFVTDIDYDAKGQRVFIEYGNGTKTNYDYDPLTFRLTHLETLRATEHLQDLSYTYDPSGNITHIQDDAQQAVYFSNQVVEPHNDYVYDAIYRLIHAEGREHIGQVTQPETTWNDEFRVKLQHPQNGQAMRQYTEHYEYDPVGNFEKIIHVAAEGNWTRSYHYGETSQIESAQKNNRLSRTIIGRSAVSLPPETYTYDAQGNMMRMPHLSNMEWGFKDELRVVDLGGGGTAYYVYDAGGQRARKVIEKNSGALIEERLYLGGFEIFRKRQSGIVELERETLHVMDDKQRIALLETKTIDTQSPVLSPQSLHRYQLSNHLGSASLELDDAGQIVSYEEYYPYGSTSYQAGRSAAEVSLKRYRYSGMERDEETELNYHGARYYAAWLGRWLSADPIGVEGGINFYQYSMDRPIVFSDTNGKQPSPGDRYHTAPHEDHPPVAQRKGAPRVEGHHPIQKQFAKSNIAGYSNEKAPSQLLSTGTGEEHTSITNDQNARRPTNWSDKSYSQARSEAVEQYRKAGLFKKGKWGGEAILKSDGYFFSLNDKVVKDPVTGKPKVIKNANLKANLGGARAAGRIFAGAGIAGMAGDVITQLHEGDSGGAAKSVAIGVAITKLIAKNPYLVPLAIMAGTIQSYDDDVKEHANRAGSWVERKTGNRVVGAVAASGLATGESLFQGTFGTVGRGIGQGAAALYIRATSDDNTVVPWKTQLWSDVFSGPSILDIARQHAGAR